MVLDSPTDLEKVPAVSLPFGRVLGLDPLYSSCPFKLRLFFLYLRADESVHSPLLLSLPTAVYRGGSGDSLLPCLRLSCHSVCGRSFFCCAEVVQSVGSSGGIALCIGADLSCPWRR